MSNHEQVQQAYVDALSIWDNITPEPDYDISYRSEPTAEQEREDAQEPTITVVMYSTAN
jgi:hypothetical protein